MPCKLNIEVKRDAEQDNVKIYIQTGHFISYRKLNQNQKLQPAYVRKEFASANP